MYPSSGACDCAVEIKLVFYSSTSNITFSANAIKNIVSFISKGLIYIYVSVSTPLCQEFFAQEHESN